MELPVFLNGNRKTANVKFAVRNDFGFIAEWREKLGDDRLPVRANALEFAQLALDRFSSHSDLQPYAGDIADFGAYIKDNPHCEVGGIVLLKCDWFPDSSVIGLCHFRRTWSNRIILDYLVAHPFSASAPPGYQDVVKGAGSALLYFIIQVAICNGCDAIWGEATQNSWEYYQKIFKLDSVKDLIYVPRANFIELSDKLHASWSKPTEAASTQNQTLNEIYDIEAKSPPFVGSKSAMLSSPRRLANRFLDLPYHVQIEISKMLGLWQSDDEGQSPAEQFRRIFQRATQQGILPNLWSEVEKKHPDGDPNKNPFLKT